MSECSHNCDSCREGCDSRQESQDLIEKLNPYSKVNKLYGVVSGKGGVGKSLVTALIASGLQKQGFKTAILDSDVTGPSIPKMFGINQKALGNDNGIIPATSKNGTKIMSVNLLLEDQEDPVIWRGPIIGGIVKQFWSDVIWDDVDVMMIDMPPGTGDVPLTVFQSLPVDGIIVVATPQDLVEMIVTKAVKMAEMMNIPIVGIVENMSYFKCPDCGKKHFIYGESHVDDLAKKFNIDTVVKIPIDPELVKLCDRGEIENTDTNYAEEIINRLKGLVKETL